MSYSGTSNRRVTKVIYYQASEESLEPHLSPLFDVILCGLLLLVLINKELTGVTGN
jgi:hypothetical protein